MASFFIGFIYHSCLGTIILSSLIRPQQFLIQIMDCYAGLVLVRPWFGRSHLWFHLVLSFRRIYLYLRFYLILCFGRMYLRCIFSSGFISSLTFGRIYLVPFESLRTYILASRISFVHAYFSFLWISLSEYTNIKDSDSILENTSYIYLKIQTYVNIRPQAWHMLVS